MRTRVVHFLVPWLTACAGDNFVSEADWDGRVPVDEDAGTSDIYVAERRR